MSIAEKLAWVMWGMAVAHVAHGIYGHALTDVAIIAACLLWLSRGRP